MIINRFVRLLQQVFMRLLNIILVKILYSFAHSFAIVAEELLILNHCLFLHGFQSFLVHRVDIFVHFDDLVENFVDGLLLYLRQLLGIFRVVNLEDPGFLFSFGELSEVGIYFNLVRQFSQFHDTL
jgi:hypothetical protein